MAAGSVCADLHQRVGVELPAVVDGKNRNTVRGEATLGTVEVVERLRFVGGIGIQNARHALAEKQSFVGRGIETEQIECIGVACVGIEAPEISLVDVAAWWC